MKAFLSLAMVFGLAGVAAAADSKANPVGSWNLEYKIGDQKRTAVLQVAKDKEAFAAHMNWPDRKDVTKCKNVSYKDGTLILTADRVLGDKTFTVEYKLTVDGDTIKGKGSVDNAGTKTEFDIEGKRKPAESKDK